LHAKHMLCHYHFSLFFPPFWMVLGFAFIISCLLGRHSTT
jgi:hypothetical protein